jgi:hypothetical protein
MDADIQEWHLEGPVKRVLPFGLVFVACVLATPHDETSSRGVQAAFEDCRGNCFRQHPPNLGD